MSYHIGLHLIAATIAKLIAETWPAWAVWLVIIALISRHEKGNRPRR